MALAGLSKATPELRGPESGKERQCGQHSRASPGGEWGLRVLDSRGISQQGGCSGSSLQTHHSHEALRPRDWRGKGPQWTWCTVCPNRSAPGSGMTDRTFPGESRAQDEARQGEAGGAEWVRFLGREVGAQVERGKAAGVVSQRGTGLQSPRPRRALRAATER